MTKPTKIPEWAISDVVNPTSGQNNVVEPTAPQKNLGWDFKEKPPRQYFNWLQRLNYLWITWFDSLLDQAVKETSDVKFKTLTLTNPAANSLIFKNATKDVLYFFALLADSGIAIRFADAILFQPNVGTGGFTIAADENVSFRPIRLAVYSKTLLPLATTADIIYVINDVDGPTIAFADGSNWRRVQDRNIIS